MLYLNETEKMALLRKHSFLARLRDWDLERLSRHSRVATAPAGEKIFSKNDPGNSMIIVITGCLLIYSTSLEGREVVFNIISEGEVCGEIALLDGEVRTADARALVETDYLVVERNQFIPFLRDNADACFAMLTMLCGRLRQTSAQVEDTAFFELRPRLAKKLLAFAEHFGQPVAGEDGGILIDLALSQRELGAMLNAGRESVNRQLRRWEKDGILALDKGRIRILDLGRLEDEAAESV